jgi:hypothetical protein
MEKIIKKVYTHTQAPRTFRVQLLEILIQENTASVERTSVFGRLEFWALVSAVITVFMIVYGLWLPENIHL